MFLLLFFLLWYEGAISFTVQFVSWTYKYYDTRQVNKVILKHNLDSRYLHQNNKARPTYQRHPLFLQTK